MTTSRKMEEDRSHMTERILNLTLDIIYLLTGESFPLPKSGDHVTITVPPCDSLKPERPNMEKILEVTKKMMELLTGEVPIRCQDVSVYFSMEEWEYLGGHRDLYKDVVMESEQIVGEESPRNETILNFALEILSLMTGEDCEVAMKTSTEHDTTRRSHETSARWRRDQNTITIPPPPALRPNMEKILEVTKKMMELLTGEVPIRCQDVSVYFSMEEWEYLGGHRDLYKDVVMENEPPLTSPDGSSKRNPPERCPRPLYSRDSTQEDLTIPHHDQVEDLRDLKIEVKEEEDEETCVTADHQSTVEAWIMVTVKEEESSLDISSDGHHISSADDDGEDNGITRPSQGERPYLCSECGHSFKRKDHLQRHLRSHAGETFPCLQCGKCFMRKERLNAHLQTHTGDKLHTCPECGKCFLGNEGLVNHLKTHTCEKPYSCPECGKYFAHKSNLNQHRKIHIGESSFSCLECGECFEKRSDLTIHQRVHTGKVIFSCLECGKLCVSKSRLTVHQRSHTGARPFPCSECHKSFVAKSELVVHQRSHTGEKPFSCPECGRGFSAKGHFNNHMKLHTGEKPFSCQECGKSFRLKDELIVHIRRHTGERPFSCLECGKGFIQKAQLRKHERMHTGVRPFSCSECGKSFPQNSHLLKHMRNHTGERPFPCLECGKRFLYKRDLVAHQRGHAGESLFSCLECGKCFTYKGRFLKHQKSHAGQHPIACP